MSDATEPMPAAEPIESDGDPSLVTDLPPVEPPSAGFIIQLFVVPGLIVLAVVGVWALFGKLAAGEQDWQSLVVELSNSNEHRRWRGAHGLAQMLQADQESESTEPKLAQNQVVIGKLTELFEKELAKTAPQENDVQFQAFLARTMGLLESNEKVIPVLREAMQSTHDREVRKNSVAAVALIAARSDEAGQPLADRPLVDDLIGVSIDTDPLMRQIAAYTLGLVNSAPGNERLIVMLDDPDDNTQLNAAIALARQESTEGLRVMESVLSESTEKFAPVGLSQTNPVERTKEENNQRYQRDARLLNTLLALETIADELTSSERDSVDALLSKVGESARVKRQYRERAAVVRKQLARKN